MDHIDRCIVDILQHNARLPVKEIASRVSLSSPAVCARIERLEKSGVLDVYKRQLQYRRPCFALFFSFYFSHQISFSLYQ